MVSFQQKKITALCIHKVVKYLNQRYLMCFLTICLVYVLFCIYNTFPTSCLLKLHIQLNFRAKKRDNFSVSTKTLWKLRKFYGILSLTKYICAYLQAKKCHMYFCSNESQATSFLANKANRIKTGAIFASTYIFMFLTPNGTLKSLRFWERMYSVVSLASIRIFHFCSCFIALVSYATFTVFNCWTDNARSCLPNSINKLKWDSWNSFSAHRFASLAKTVIYAFTTIACSLCGNLEEEKNTAKQSIR